jgi:hypothetical protein
MQKIKQMIRFAFPIVVISWFLVTNSLFAQNEFYLRPSAEIKYGTSRKAFDNIPSPLFTYTSNRWVWDRGVDFGIQLGYRFNQRRTAVEIGLHTHTVALEWKILFDTYNPSTNQYTPRTLENRVQITGKKIPILITTQIVYWDSLRFNHASNFSLHLNLLAGVNSYYLSDGYMKVFRPDTFLLAPQQPIAIYAETRSWSTTKFGIKMMQLGLSAELRKNNKEWLVFTCYGLIRGIWISSDVKIDILNTLPNAPIMRHYYTTYSTSQFICLEISKKILLNRTKRKKELSKVRM